MGTEIITYNNELRDDDDCYIPCNILLNRYWGGKDDGTMFQITEKNAVSKYVNISEMEFVFMFYKYLKHENDEIESKDILYHSHIIRLKENRKIIKWLNKRYKFEVDR